MLLRLTFEDEANFRWDLNWVYVLGHRDDLVAGKLERAVVTAANS